MKRVRIRKGTVGLVYRKEEYKKVLTEGTYWISPFEQVNVLERKGAFTSTEELAIYLQDENLKNLLSIVEVKDGELSFMYENGIFKTVLSAGIYAWWKGYTPLSFQTVNTREIEVSDQIEKTILSRTNVLPYLRVYQIESYETALLFVDGKFKRELEAGTYHFWKNASPIQVYKIDTRQQKFEVSGQEILSKDKAALRVNFFALYQVNDIKKAIMENKDFEKQLYILLQLALREYLGSLTLDEILEKKESVSSFIHENTNERVAALGVKLLDSGIRDIILPGDVKEIMNQVLIAQKQAQANIITRREETASTRSLLNTAKLMEENEMLFKLKEMEYVEKISEKINNISLSGGSQVVNQLKEIFTVNSKQ
ncbi:slipin family protein [Marinifilum fragile]|uniref:slipin family protein n=1 Tax=Marinifilum fragile TaxID=570161 RepID=UPI0006D1AE99|nr:slipin family protein [Marinifilum fragile]